MYIDTHCHLDFPDFNEDREILLKNSKKDNLYSIINVGTNLSSSVYSVELASRYDLVKAVVGVHPSEAQDFEPTVMKEICELAKNSNVVGIGETGLDYYRGKNFAEKQKELLRRHIQLAGMLNLPLVVHQRDSRDELIDIFEKEQLPSKVVFRCFGGDKIMAEYCSKKGFYVSFTGIITFRKADDIREVCLEYPIERIMAETDSPFLSPVPYRGKRNDPSKVRYVVEKIAEIKGGNLESLREMILVNSKKFFNIV